MGLPGLVLPGACGEFELVGSLDSGDVDVGDCGVCSVGGCSVQSLWSRSDARSMVLREWSTVVRMNSFSAGVFRPGSSMLLVFKMIRGKCNSEMPISVNVISLVFGFSYAGVTRSRTCVVRVGMRRA